MPDDVRPLRPGSYEWADRDDDVVGALEPFVDDPYIIAALSLVRSEGWCQAGIYIDVAQAQEIIAFLRRRIGHRDGASVSLGERRGAFLADEGTLTVQEVCEWAAELDPLLSPPMIPDTLSPDDPLVVSVPRGGTARIGRPDDASPRDKRPS